jgi:NAD(P)-dependent dehydrogenase (short-subunit alcohol dehydrogenase family)
MPYLHIKTIGDLYIKNQYNDLRKCKCLVGDLIAQHFVENEAYFPAAFQATPEFKAELAKVPLGRLAKGREDALFALFLASDESDFLVGQSIAFCGGWAE